ncbi:MAG: DNA-3-methyladenine glycosylase I [Corynebacterium sp.]|nr:DNA-3-methyladenine glycosylase I [Corynebacterium sp.]
MNTFSQFKSDSDQSHTLICCSDGKHRPAWAAHSALVQRYYDKEWGTPITTEHELLEVLSLLGFQSGLSWHLVLRKRAALRKVFADFYPDAVAQLSDATLAHLTTNPNIIRNSRKLAAVRTNARAIIEMRERGGALEFIKQLVQKQPISASAPDSDSESSNSAAEMLAKSLRAEGFTFVGPKLCHSLLCSIGLVSG